MSLELNKSAKATIGRMKLTRTENIKLTTDAGIRVSNQNYLYKCIEGYKVIKIQLIDMKRKTRQEN